MRTGPLTTRSARGVTMIEVVLASVLMAMIAMTLVSGLGYIHAAHRRQEANLGAAEMGNRIMLQLLDSEKSLPSDALPIAYGSHGQLRYYWKVEKDKVDLRLNQAGALAEAGRTSGIRLNNLLDLVTVRVWQETVPNVNPALTGVPADFTLKRIVDPIATRNPDSIMKQFSTPEGLADFLNRVGQNQGGG